MKRKIATLALALCLCAGMTLTASATTQYSDVAADAWYASAVTQVSQSGTMTGTSDTTFTPDGLVTRGTVVTVLWRMAGSPAVADAPTFSDVSADSWYGQAVAWAQSNGVATGYTDGTFLPDAAVTREALAVFLTRFDALDGAPMAEGVLGLYSDSDTVSDWAVESVQHVIGTGLITGNNDGTLDPAGSATRAQLAVILERMTTVAMG